MVQPERYVSINPTNNCACSSDGSAVKSRSSHRKATRGSSGTDITTVDRVESPGLQLQKSKSLHKRYFCLRLISILWFVLDRIKSMY
jgi:hypothetical protein